MTNVFYKKTQVQSAILFLIAAFFSFQKSNAQNGIFDKDASFIDGGGGKLTASAAWLKSWKNGAGNVCDARLTFVVSGSTNPSANGSYILAIPFGNNIGTNGDQFWGNSGSLDIPVVIPPSPPCGVTQTAPAQTITITPTWSINNGTCTGGTNVTSTVAPFQINIAAVTVVGATCVLPIKLANFSTINNSNSVTIKWTTLTQNTIQYFQVERAIDGIGFTKIGTQNPNSLDINKEYSFIDNSPNAINYYRLKIIELSGEISYSKTVYVKSGSHFNINILPNPAKNSIVVNGSKKGTNLQIIDISGKAQLTYTLTSDNEVIDITSLKNGTYICKFLDKNSTTIKRFTVIK